jgi:hypothetical protein
MFSRDDYGRGPRFPLLWVFGPFVLGAVIVTAVGIIARGTQGFPDLELAEQLEQLGADDDPLLAEATDFAWDRVCVFSSSATKADVDAALGFEWGVVGGDPYEDRLLLVFVRDDEVVKHFYLRRNLVDRPVPPGDCRLPDDESTRL